MNMNTQGPVWPVFPLPMPPSSQPLPQNPNNNNPQVTDPKNQQLDRQFLRIQILLGYNKSIKKV